eukprot:TRINITY_DN89649_c0_g1_i1.p1 TRINITY_DN89649_c0_g1~~TRINITY_DN89649_c0_g1_i1.p1  ORF type:complete len:447 (-),score=112.05 TRINITY_DN89649_c0_g1_i1:293-1633(-)
MISMASHQHARSASPKPKFSEQQLTSRVKELEESNKAMERSQKAVDRKRLQDVKEAKKKLTRELQVAQRNLTRNEHEASKLAGKLTRAEHEVQQAVARQSREAERREQGIGRIRQKHGKIGSALRDKMTTVGQARGRLAHAQMAMKMLQKGVEIGTGVPSMIQPSGNEIRQATQSLASQTDLDLYDGDTQLRDDLIVKLREEADQLRQANQELQEKLAAADRLLAEAQAAPTQKSNVETEMLLLGSAEAILNDDLGSASNLKETQPEGARGKNCHTFRDNCSHEDLSSSGEMEDGMVKVQASVGQKQLELVLTAEQKRIGRPDQAAFTQPNLPVANMAGMSSVTQFPMVFPTLLAGAASVPRIVGRPQTPLAVPGRMVSYSITSSTQPKYSYQQQGKQLTVIQPVSAVGAAQLKVVGGVAVERLAVTPTAVPLRAEPVAASSAVRP